MGQQVGGRERERGEKWDRGERNGREVRKITESCDKGSMVGTRGEIERIYVG